MSIHQETEYPWLPDRKGVIRDAIDTGKIVFGIGLGAQLIADVLGANTNTSAENEAGYR